MNAIVALALVSNVVADPPGRIPPPVPQWAQNFSDGAIVQRLVDAAITSGAKSVRVPAGDYKFTNDVKQLVVAGANGLSIRGDGSKNTFFWFFPGNGIQILSCIDTKLSGIATDTITPPYAQAKLVSLDHSNSSLNVIVEVSSG